MKFEIGDISVRSNGLPDQERLFAIYHASEVREVEHFPKVEQIAGRNGCLEFVTVSFGDKGNGELQVFLDLDQLAALVDKGAKVLDAALEAERDAG